MQFLIFKDSAHCTTMNGDVALLYNTRVLCVRLDVIVAMSDTKTPAHCAANSC